MLHPSPRQVAGITQGDTAARVGSQKVGAEQGQGELKVGREERMRFHLPGFNTFPSGFKTDKQKNKALLSIRLTHAASTAQWQSTDFHKYHNNNNTINNRNHNKLHVVPSAASPERTGNDFHFKS